MPCILEGSCFNKNLYKSAIYEKAVAWFYYLPALISAQAQPPQKRARRNKPRQKQVLRRKLLQKLTKTKEFIIPSDTKAEFRIYGYQYPNETTKK
jgi:hypothetical protein